MVRKEVERRQLGLGVVAHDPPEVHPRVTFDEGRHEAGHVAVAYLSQYVGVVVGRVVGEDTDVQRADLDWIPRRGAVRLCTRQPIDVEPTPVSAQVAEHVVERPVLLNEHDDVLDLVEVGQPGPVDVGREQIVAIADRRLEEPRNSGESACRVA